MKAANMQQKPPEDQEKLNVALLDAILDWKAEIVITSLLDQGADVNCFAAPSEYEETERTTPLALAVSVGHVTAVPLLLARGAKPRGITLSGSGITDAAVINGDWRIADALLKADKDLVKLLGDAGSSHDENHLHRALFALYPFPVIQDGVWESPEMQHTLIDYWDDTKPVEIPNRPLTVSYPGNFDMATILLARQEKMMFMKTREGISAWDVVFNPRAYQQHFFDVNGHNTIRCLTGANDPNPNVLRFQIDLSDRHGVKRFSDTEADYGINRPLVTVIFDFTGLQNLFKRYVERSLDLQVLAQTQQHSHQIYGMKQQLRLVDEHFLNPLDEQQRFEAWLARPGHENLKVFHDTLDTRFRVLIHGFTGVASNMLQANVGDKHLGALRDVLGGLSALVKIAPMVPGIAAGAALLKRGADKVAEIRQRNVAYCVTTFGDERKMADVRRRLTRRLTEAYTQQLLALEDPRQAEAKQGSMQKKLQKGKQELLKSPFVSPAEQAAMFAMLWIVDQLHEAPEIAEEVRTKGLDQVLFSLILQKDPPEKLKTFWAKELVKKAFGSELLTKTGKAWDPQAFFASPGLCVMEGGNFQCYTASHSNPKVYGWRLVSALDVEQMPDFKLLPPNKTPAFEHDWFEGSSGHATSSSDGSPPRKPALAPFTPAYQAAACSMAAAKSAQPVVVYGEQAKVGKR